MASSDVPTVINTLAGHICVMTNPDKCIGDSVERIKNIMIDIMPISDESEIGFVQMGRVVDLSEKWAQLYMHPIMAYVKPDNRVVISTITSGAKLHLDVEKTMKLMDYSDDIKKYFGIASPKELTFIHCGKVLTSHERWGDLDLKKRRNLLVFVKPQS